MTTKTPQKRGYVFFVNFTKYPLDGDANKPLIRSAFSAALSGFGWRADLHFSIPLIIPDLEM